MIKNRCGRTFDAARRDGSSRARPAIVPFMFLTFILKYDLQPIILIYRNCVHGAPVPVSEPLLTAPNRENDDNGRHSGPPAAAGIVQNQQIAPKRMAGNDDFWTTDRRLWDDGRTTLGRRADDFGTTAALPAGCFRKPDLAS